MTAALAAGGLVVLVMGPLTTATAADSGAGRAERPANPESAQAPVELAREGLAKMLQALNKLIEAVPQFEMPEMTENGDIILRRKRPSSRQPNGYGPAAERIAPPEI